MTFLHSVPVTLSGVMRDVNLGMRLLSGHPRWVLVVTVCLRFLFALQAVFLTICDSSWFGRQMSFDTLAGGPSRRLWVFTQGLRG